MRRMIFAALALINLALPSCNPGGGNGNPTPSGSSNCDSTFINDRFSVISKGMTYQQIKAIIGTDGDNYRNDDFPNGHTHRFYNWMICPSDSQFIECWVCDIDGVILAHKTTRRSGCVNNVSQSTFSALTTEISYLDAVNLFGGVADTFRKDYRYADDKNDMMFTRWYDCGKPENYIEVWFKDGKKSLATKSF